jgi:site-specific DNA recombinase
MTIRAAIYARVSDQKQADKGTIASQLATLPAFVKARGWTLAGTYVDDGKTAKAGHLAKREGFARLVRDMAAGAFDIVAVVDIDRLTRSEDQRERGEILGAFQRAGVKIAELHGAVHDLSTFSGDMMTTLRALFGAEENRVRRERTTRGREATARAGRPPLQTPWGVVYDRTRGVYRLDRKVAKLVREMFERVASGESTQVIAADMQRRGVKRARSTKWQRERVYAIVTSAAYRGEWMVDRKRRIIIQVPAIVSDELWQAADAALAKGKLRGLRRTRFTYLIEGLGVCGVCESRICIHGATDHRRGHTVYRYYYCWRRRRKLYGETCQLRPVSTKDADARVWTAIEKVLERPAHLEAMIARRRAQTSAQASAWTGDLHQAEKRIEALGRKEKALLERFGRDLLSEEAMDAQLAHMSKERALLRNEVAAARAQMAGTAKDEESAAKVRLYLAQLHNRLEQASPEMRRDFVRTLVEKGGIVFHANGRIEVRLIVGVDVAGADGPCFGMGGAAGCRSAHEAKAGNHVLVRVVA